MSINKSKIFKSFSVFLALALIISVSFVSAAGAYELPEAQYTGSGDASAVLYNIGYSDVGSSNSWAKKAIYETSALGILKMYDDAFFGLKRTVTKEEALGMVFTATGREAEAELAGQSINQKRAAAEKKKDPLEVFYDGCIKIAGSEGMISKEQASSALGENINLTGVNFNRTSPVERQEMAFWLALATKLPPVYDKQNVYNSYIDWRNIHSDKLPYIEAIMRNKIMSGDNTGRFNPLQPVTREQAAQILKNAEDSIFPLVQFEKLMGIVEKVNYSNDKLNGQKVVKSTFDIRNSNGRIHTIEVTAPSEDRNAKVNEQIGSAVSEPSKELIVYKDGNIGNSTLIKQGDRIEYIVGSDKKVKFVNVISSESHTQYIVAQINNIDTKNLKMDVVQLLNLNYPDMDLASRTLSLEMGNEKVNETYRYSNNVSTMIDGKKTDIKSILPGSSFILTIKNNMVTDINSFMLKNEAEAGIVKGIVEDNKPQLGYITLFNEDGTGVGSAALRTYNYLNPNSIEIFKNHKKSSLETIEAGDTVFLKLDSTGNIESISAVENYTVKYGRIITRKPSQMAVEFDDGTQQVLNIDKNVFVTSKNRLSRYDNLKDGDRVKLLLHITNRFIRVKEIAVEGDEHFISNIYRGKVSYIDDMSGELITENLRVFDRGNWVPAGQKGITSIRLSEEVNMYADNRSISPQDVNRLFKNNDAYIAVQKDYGGKELAAFISFRNEEDTEDKPYDDSIINSSASKGEFSLSKDYKKIKFGPGTIVVKEGRLVAGSSISNGDSAYVVANRNYDSQDFNANVVEIKERSNMNFAQVYRGRISKVNESKDFTVESFSQLDGLTWRYSNTPKTFRLTNGTQILDDGGVVAQRDFMGFGPNTYVNRTVYIIANDTGAIVVSTAPYGIYNAKGEVYEITGGTTGEDGNVVEEPTGLKIKYSNVYDPATYLWMDGKEMALSLLKNSIVIKNNSIVKPSDIKTGDRLRVIKKDNSASGDAYIVIVEN